MKVSVVVINWNGADKLRKYFPEVLKVKGVDEFIVTDDASTDESIALLEQQFPQVKIVKRDKNRGFSSNANSGVKNAIGELVLLLNPDAIPGVDCINNALPYFNDRQLFSIGCNTGGNWSWAKWEKGFFWHYMKKNKPETHQTLWARGGSGIFRKSVFEELGGMDELFNPYYEEDTDLGYRATKRGYKNFWVKECSVSLPKEKGVIAENIYRQEVSKIAQRNQLLFIWKNITDKDLLSQHIKMLFSMLLTCPRYWKVFLSAIVHLPKIIVKRNREAIFAKLTDSEILGKFPQ